MKSYIHFIRHGVTEGNANRWFYGWADVNLLPEGVEELKRLAYSDITAALKLGLEMTLEHLSRQGSEVSPESREALAWLNR